MASRFLSLGVLALVLASLVATVSSRTLSADEAEDFQLDDGLLQAAVDAILEAQAAGGETPSRRSLIEVPLARAVRSRATKDTYLMYSKEKSSKSKAEADLMHATQNFNKKVKYLNSQIDKLEGQKAALERENRSLKSACLKTSYLS